MASDNLSRILRSAQKAHDFWKLAQALSLIDKAGAKAIRCPELVSGDCSFRLGITGPPGAGKSTLISKIIKKIREHKLTVAVLAVDPSSPLTKGAILGDRIRMLESVEDPGVFIRSLGSRGDLGGISANVYLMARALEYFGFDFIIIETVGVGQTEVDIRNAADLVAVVVVPESGDAVQAMKAGLLEIGSLVVVNKSDRPNAEQLTKELASTLKCEVFNTEALAGRGVDQLVEFVLNHAKKSDWKKKRKDIQRLQAEAKALLQRQMQIELNKKILKIRTTKDLVQQIGK